MRILIMIATLLLASSAWASKPEIPDNLRHHVRMTPLDGLPTYPSLELDDLPVAPTRQYVEGWEYPLKNINMVSAIIADDSGYYIAGTTLHAEDIDIEFNRSVIDDIMDDPYSVASSSDEVFTTVSGKDIALSLIHLAADGTLEWVSSFENDLVSSGPMIRLRDGRIVLALTPLIVDEASEFSSFLFFLSESGAILQRKEFRDELINSLFLTSDNQILAGIVRREIPPGKSQMDFRQYAYFLDTEGHKASQVDLADHPGDQLVFKALSLIKEYDDAYFFSGGDAVFKLSKKGEALEKTYLRPILDHHSDYHIKAFFRDNKHNLALLGFYGREKSLLAEMQVNHLQSITRPTRPSDELSPSYQRMLDNPLLRGVYNDMLSDMRAQIRERGTPFNALLTSDWTLINLIDPKQESTQYTYAGSSNADGTFLIEKIKNGKQEQFYLLGKDAKLSMRDRNKEQTPFCFNKCLLVGDKLLYLQWDDDLPGYSLHQGEFVQLSTQADTTQ
jgi:hypothetical protein